ncbi:hypothetical protein [Actinomyces wuliandei]|uniref:hypothetical protein n=1 Tax=Actinomyces wuliandei TaxID=2057743 RepID=UPI001C582ED4|nr:hypothetical protein [Actinomyces wuliandei]
MADARQEGERSLLHDRYKGLNGQALVAYVDETMRPPGECRPGEAPFYTMAAVLLRVRDLDHARRDIKEIAGGSWWHTVQAATTHDGRARVRDMLTYLARYQDTCVVAVHHRPAPGATSRAMRATCLTGLLAALSRPGPHHGATWEPVPLIVLERPQTGKDLNRDQHTTRQTRQAGLVPRTTVVTHASPSSEQLLWLPDLVAHTWRRQVTHGETAAHLLDAQTVTIDLAAADTSDPLAAAAIIQGVSPQLP